MSTVNPSQSNAGDLITAAAINNPINQLAAVINGGIDASNISDSSITTAKVAAGLATTKLADPYKFSVYRNAALTITTTATSLGCDTSVFDTSNNYNVATGRFTAPAAGFYFFKGNASVANVGSQDSYIMLYKNGTAYKRGTQKTPAVVSSESYEVSDLVQAAASDYFEIYLVMVTAGRSLNPGQTLSYFTGFLVSTT